MNKNDDGWWDAVGKNDWREQQLEREREAEAATTVEAKDKLIKKLIFENDLSEAMIAMREAQIRLMLAEMAAAGVPSVFKSNRTSNRIPAGDLILPAENEEREN